MTHKAPARRGRPPLGDKKLTKELRARVTDEDLEKLDDLAEILGTNRAATVRYIIRAAMLQPPRVILSWES